MVAFAMVCYTKLSTEMFSTVQKEKEAAQNSFKFLKFLKLH